MLEDNLFESIIEDLRDSDPNIRMRAVQSLSRLEPRKAVEGLKLALRDRNRNIGYRAAEAVARMSIPQAESAIISLLKGKDRNARINAAMALKEMKSEEAVLEVVRLLKDDYSFYLPLQQGLKNNQSPAILSALIEGLKNQKVRTRKYFAMALGEMEFDEVADALLETLTEKDRFIREGVVLAIKYGSSKIRSDRAGDKLFQILKESLENLTSIKGFRRNDLFEKIQHILLAAGFMKLQKAVPLLVGLLASSEIRNLKILSVLTIGEIGSESAVPLLINIIRQNKDQYIAEASAEALRKIKSDLAVDELLEALKCKVPAIRLYALNALEYARTPDVIEAVIECLKDTDVHCRRSAARILGIIKTQSAVSFLLTALEDKDKWVGWNAAWALGQIKSELATEGVLNLSNSVQPLVRRNALEALGQTALDISGVMNRLIDALNDANVSVARSASWAIRQINMEKAVNLLATLKRDRNPEVSRRAANAIKRLKFNHDAYLPHFPVKSSPLYGIWP